MSQGVCGVVKSERGVVEGGRGGRVDVDGSGRVRDGRHGESSRVMKAPDRHVWLLTECA